MYRVWTYEMHTGTSDPTCSLTVSVYKASVYYEVMILFLHVRLGKQQRIAIGKLRPNNRFHNPLRLTLKY